MKRVLIIGLSVLTSAAVAGELDVPNQFRAGAPAVAAEVNENFAAVEAAVDGNAQDIAANATDLAANAAAIGGLQMGLPIAGITVRLDGVAIGRYTGFGRPPIEVANVPPATGTEIVAAAVSLGSSDIVTVVSEAGYRFAIWTTGLVDPNFVEGELDAAPVFYDDATCTGNAYFPVEGDTGFFTSFEAGTADVRPAKRWALRQGVLWASPDPDDPNPVYMIRRGQTAQTVPLLSLLVFNPTLNAPFCVDVTNIPGFDANNPLHVNNTAFAVEPVDPIETGIGDRLGGQLTIGAP